MILKKRALLNKLNKTILGDAIKSPTSGTLSVMDNEVFLEIGGLFRVLTISYTGNIFIYNELNDGYGINVSNNRIIITNYMAKGLKPNNILFSFDGEIDVGYAEVRTFISTNFKLSLFNSNKLEYVNTSDTKFEDNTLILQNRSSLNRDISKKFEKNKVNDSSIKGLYSETLFGDSHSGFYNYHPKEKFYMTGKTITNKSTPIGQNPSQIKSMVKKQMLDNIYKKMSTKLSAKQIEKTVIKKEEQPVKNIITKKTEVQKSKSVRIIKRERGGY
tara:strand:+ start:6227 stop:7045 length:819 start_codon:yes stop_codon:yes gene_type:complete